MTGIHIFQGGEASLVGQSQQLCRPSQIKHFLQPVRQLDPRPHSADQDVHQLLFRRVAWLAAQRIEPVHMAVKTFFPYAISHTTLDHLIFWRAAHCGYECLEPAQGSAVISPSLFGFPVIQGSLPHHPAKKSCLKKRNAAWRGRILPPWDCDKRSCSQRALLGSDAIHSKTAICAASPLQGGWERRLGFRV